jgi:hypothetical protein
MNTLEILEDNGFSIFGTKTLKYSDSDNHFLCVEDSGGFGEKSVTNLSYSQFCKNTEIFLLKNSPSSNIISYFAKTGFNNNKSVIYVNDDSCNLIDLIGSKIERHAVTPKIWFPAHVNEAELDYLKQQLFNESNEYAEFFNNNIVSSEFQASNYIPVCISSKDFDFFITFPGIPSRKIDLKTIKIKYSDGCIIIDNNIPIGNRCINGLTIQSEFLARNNYLNSIGLGHLYKLSNINDNNQKQGITNSITLDGYLNEERISKGKYFATIDKALFIIHDGNIDSPFAIINLSSNELSLDGTSEEFVISPNKSTIFRISSESRDFIQSVFNSSDFQFAANRSSRHGPFVASNDQNLIRIDKDNLSYLLTTNGINTSQLDSNIAERKLVLDGKSSKLLIHDYTLQATMPMLEATSYVLNSLTFKSNVAKNFDQNITKLLGLEGMYLTYCVYGGLARICLLINEVLDIQNINEIACSNERKNIFMEILYSSIPMLINDLEKIFFYFPSLLTKNDSNLFSKIGIKNLVNLNRCENSYINSLRGNTAFVQHFSRIEGAFSRLASIRRLKNRSDSLAKAAPLGVNAALSILNPIFLVSTIQQGISLFNQKTDVTASESEIADECFEICYREWNHIVRCLLPVLSAKFAQEVYPSRLALGKVLMEANKSADSGALDRLHFAVSDRIGRLVSYFEFPCEISEKISRQKCVDFIFEMQKNPDGFDATPI